MRIKKNTIPEQEAKSLCEFMESLYENIDQHHKISTDIAGS